MASSDDLTISAVLYGANFQAWRVRIDALLRLHGVTFCVTQDWMSSKYGYSQQEWNSFSETAATIIRTEVHPHVFKRVPENDRMDGKRLMDRLEAFAVRFRFVDLPAELRKKVYEYIIDDSGAVKIEPVQKRISGYPAITKTVRLLREESLPLLYKRSTFHFSFISKSHKADQRINVAAAVRNWALNIPHSQLKQLRSAELNMRFYCMSSKPGISRTIQFTFSEESGIRMHWLNRNSWTFKFIAASKDLLDAHIETVESNRKVFGMQGEGIILAILGDPKLWAYKTLELT